MTRTAAPRPRGTSRPRGVPGTNRPQWMRAAAMHLGVYLFLWAWLWGICAVGAVAVAVLVDRVGTVNVSIIWFVRDNLLVWFLFSVAIYVVATYLTPHVANGMTRGSFARGGLAAVTAGSVLNAGTAAVLLLIEGAVYDRMGWSHDRTSGPESTLDVWEEGVGFLLFEHTLVILAGSVSGLLVGIAYYRFSGWRGTLYLPLTLLPLLAVMFLTSWSGPFMPWQRGEVTGIAVGALITLAGAAAFALLCRRTPITRTES